MKVILNEKLTIGDSIRNIAMSHERTIMVVNDEGKLVGVVTQGDLLRAIWNGAELESSIEVCINYNPITLVDGEPDDRAIKIFAENGALVIPVIDINRKLLRVVNVRELLK